MAAQVQEQWQGASETAYGVDVVAALQYRRQLATAEARAKSAEQAAAQAVTQMREREGVLRRQFQAKLQAAEQEWRAETQAELDNFRHQATAARERDSMALQLAASRAADQRVDLAYEEADARVQAVLRDAAEQISAAQQREEQAHEDATLQLTRERRAAEQDAERRITNAIKEEQEAWRSRLDESVSESRADRSECEARVEAHHATRHALIQEQNAYAQTRNELTALEASREQLKRRLVDCEQREADAHASLARAEARSAAKLRDALAARTAAESAHDEALAALQAQHSTAVAKARDSHLAQQATLATSDELRAQVSVLERQLVAARHEESVAKSTVRSECKQAEAEALAAGRANAAHELTVAVEREKTLAQRALDELKREIEARRHKNTHDSQAIALEVASVRAECEREAAEALAAAKAMAASEAAAALEAAVGREKLQSKQALDRVMKEADALRSECKQAEAEALAAGRANAAHELTVAVEREKTLAQRALDELKREIEARRHTNAHDSQAIALEVASVRAECEREAAEALAAAKAMAASEAAAALEAAVGREKLQSKQALDRVMKEADALRAKETALQHRVNATATENTAVLEDARTREDQLRAEAARELQAAVASATSVAAAEMAEVRERCSVELASAVVDRHAAVDAVKAELKAAHYEHQQAVAAAAKSHALALNDATSAHEAKLADERASLVETYEAEIETVRSHLSGTTAEVEASLRADIHATRSAHSEMMDAAAEQFASELSESERQRETLRNDLVLELDEAVQSTRAAIVEEWQDKLAKAVQSARKDAEDVGTAKLREAVATEIESCRKENLSASASEVASVRAECEREAAEALAAAKAMAASEAAAALEAAVGREKLQSKQALDRVMKEADALRAKETALQHRVNATATENTAVLEDARTREDQLRAEAARELQAAVASATSVAAAEMAEVRERCSVELASAVVDRHAAVDAVKAELKAAHYEHQQAVAAAAKSHALALNDATSAHEAKLADERASLVETYEAEIETVRSHLSGTTAEVEASLRADIHATRSAHSEMMDAAAEQFASELSESERQRETLRNDLVLELDEAVQSTRAAIVEEWQDKLAKAVQSARKDAEDVGTAKLREAVATEIESCRKENLSASASEVASVRAECEREAAEALAAAKAMAASEAAAALEAAVGREKLQSKQALDRVMKEADALRAKETALQHRVNATATENTAVLEDARTREDQLRAEAARELQAAVASATSVAAAEMAEVREQLESELAQAGEEGRAAARAEAEHDMSHALASAKVEAEKNLERAVAVARQEWEASYEATQSIARDETHDMSIREERTHGNANAFGRGSVDRKEANRGFESDESLASETGSELSAEEDADESSTNLSSVRSFGSVDRKADVDAAKRQSAAGPQMANPQLAANPAVHTHEQQTSSLPVPSASTAELQPQHNAVCDTCNLPFFTASGKSTCVDCRKPGDASVAAETHAADPHELHTHHSADHHGDVGQRTPGNDSIVLDEAIVEHEATEEEVNEYARWLGMDPEVDQELMWIAREGIDSKLPPEWKPCKSPAVSDEIYYFNFDTGESTWDHPSDEHYKQLYKTEKRKLKERNSKSAAEEKMALLWDDEKEPGSADVDQAATDSQQKSMSVSFGPTVTATLDTLSQDTTPEPRVYSEAQLQTPEQAEATEIRRRGASLFAPPSPAEQVEERGLGMDALEALEVGTRIEVMNAEGTWTCGEIIKNRTKKHAGHLKVHYDGTKKKKDEWLAYDCGRFGKVVRLPLFK